jgi:hypothetical protein
MKQLMTAWCALGLALGVIVDLEAAPRARWEQLGQRTVTDRLERDVIKVTGQRGNWTAIKIAVSKRAVQFRSVEVVFANGTRQHVKLRDVIPAGGESRVIDLVGDDRVIQRIELRYDAQSLGGTAKVRVFGRR